MSTTKVGKVLSKHQQNFSNNLDKIWRSIYGFVNDNRGDNFRTIVYIKTDPSELIKINIEMAKSDCKITTELEKHIVLLNLEDIEKIQKSLKKKNNGSVADTIRKALVHDPNENLIIIHHVSKRNDSKETIEIESSRIYTFPLDKPYVKDLKQVDIGFPEKLLTAEKQDRKEWTEKAWEDILTLTQKRNLKQPEHIKKAFEEFIENAKYKHRVLQVDAFIFVLFSMKK